MQRNRFLLAYGEGYRKALMDLHQILSAWEPHFRADRKRNNVKNVVWLLECIMEDPEPFTAFGADTPVHHRIEGKKVIYSVNHEEWPVCCGAPRNGGQGKGSGNFEHKNSP